MCVVLEEDDPPMHLQHLLVDVGGVRQREDALVDQQLAVPKLPREALSRITAATGCQPDHVLHRASMHEKETSALSL